MLLPSAAISIEEAYNKGYRPLTVSFWLPREREMLDRFQMELKGEDIALVGNAKCPEIWRKGLVSLEEKNCVPIPLDSRATRLASV